jgi:hypothetical protein
VAPLEITATSKLGSAPSSPVWVAAGQRDVVLRLRPGGGLRGRVVDASTGAGCEATVECIREGSSLDPSGERWTTESNEDGEFTQAGLEPGRYSLLASTMGGRFAVLPDLQIVADAEVKDLVLAVSPGGRLRLRYEGSASRVSIGVTAKGVLIGDRGWMKRGDHGAARVPAGSIVIEMTVDGNTLSLRKSVDFAPGEEKEVVLGDSD